MQAGSKWRLIKIPEIVFSTFTDSSYNRKLVLFDRKSKGILEKVWVINPSPENSFRSTQKDR
jgi:hypothetical protein